MPTTEEQIKNIIAKHKGKASRQEIAGELKINLSYTDLVCQGLIKKGEINPSGGGFFILSNLQKKAKPLPPKQQKPRSKVKQSEINRISQEKKTKSDLLSSDIPGLTQRLVKVIEQAGHKTVYSLAHASIVKLMRKADIGLGQAAKLINHARAVLSKKKTN